LLDRWLKLLFWLLTGLIAYVVIASLGNYL
jgi:hypothetical protein